MESFKMKRLIIYLDGTITSKETSDYKNVTANQDIVEKIIQYKKNGYEIVIFSSRNMRTHNGNIGKINIHTLPLILEWLELHGVPHDEVIVGKPWCGFEGFYVDDKSIRPSEFAKLSANEIEDLLKKEEEF